MSARVHLRPTWSALPDRIACGIDKSGRWQSKTLTSTTNETAVTCLRCQKAAADHHRFERKMTDIQSGLAATSLPVRTPDPGDTTPPELEAG